MKFSSLMNARRITTLAAGTCLFVFSLLGRPNEARASQPLILNDPAYPSAITVTDGSTLIGYADTRMLLNFTCIVFMNNGPKTATRVGLNLAYVDAEGRVMSVDVYYPRGKFPVGVRSAYSTMHGATVERNGNCEKSFRPDSDNLESFTHYGEKSAKVVVAAILVSAREIVYDDGTAYRTDSGPHTGDHVIIPPPPPASVIVSTGPPIVSAASDTGAPLEVTRIFGEDFNRQVFLMFVNRGTAAANRVLIDLVLVDRTGTVAGMSEMNIVGAFPPNRYVNEASGSRAGVPGKAEGDSFMYDGENGRAAIGRIIAVPVRMEFTDGTSWNSPHPPHVGDKLTQL